MYKRVLARRLAVQALYQWQMTALNVDDLLLEFDLERELGKADKSYFIEVITGVVNVLRNLNLTYKMFWIGIGNGFKL